MLTKADFIWFKMQWKLKHSEILLQFKITVFHLNICECNLFMWLQYHYFSLQSHMTLKKSLQYDDLVFSYCQLLFVLNY